MPRLTKTLSEIENNMKRQEALKVLRAEQKLIGKLLDHESVYSLVQIRAPIDHLHRSDDLCAN